MYPGFHRGHGEEFGMNRTTDALNAIHDNMPGAVVRIVLETTAGQGTAPGYSFGQIACTINGMKESSRLAFCLDTCHAFVAGYDIKTKAGYHNIFKKIDDTIGMQNMRILHLNDSKKEMNSRIDRHEDIGKGMIGRKVLKLIMRDESLENIPKA